MTTLPILCFNDVYRVSQKYVPQPGAPERRISKTDATKSGDDDRINVAQFGQLLETHREKWADRPASAGSGKEGLVLFAGDVFNPSVESSVTRGSHMIPILNSLSLDCACIGNHDFDFGECAL
jgi:5'-nucleotidase